MTDAKNDAGAQDGLGDLAQRMGEDVSGLVRRELDAAKQDLSGSAKQGAAGAGLLGGASIAGMMALLFGSLGVWRGLGERIGLGRSAAVMSLLFGGAAVALSATGGGRLAAVKRRLA
ncbi:phage holin family protein [Amnibacterium sp.]|uniref:phage holin family protein n=1 Tax=Amnibacterium sp. TaxID=1872496 RepID=UPI003F7B6A61